MWLVSSPAHLIAPAALFARCALSLRLGPKGFTLWNPDKGQRPLTHFVAYLWLVSSPARLRAPAALFARCAFSLRLGPKGFTLWKPDKGQRPLTRFSTSILRIVTPPAPHSACGAVRALVRLRCGWGFGFHSNTPKGFTLWKPAKGIALDPSPLRRGVTGNLLF